MQIITPTQNKALSRLKKRIRGEQYKLKLVLVYATSLMPGYFSITARTPELYAKMLNLLRRVLPNVQPAYETGRGWHTGDRTEYHFGSFDFFVQP